MSTVQISRVGEYMTIREAARLKGCSETALYQAIRDKGLTHARLGRQILVRQSDIVSYEPTYHRGR